MKGNKGFKIMIPAGIYSNGEVIDLCMDDLIERKE